MAYDDEPFERQAFKRKAYDEPYDSEVNDNESHDDTYDDTYDYTNDGEMDGAFDDNIDDVEIAVGDLLELSPLAQLVDDLTFKLVSLDAPDWYINPEFGILFAERSSYDSVVASSPLTFAPGLFERLTSPTPPTMDYFMSLPVAAPKTWAVYVVIMVKDGFETGLYIGSGTEGIYGVTYRLACYKPGDNMAPRFVKQAFAQGYVVAHKGIICSTPLPTPGLAPRVRARFLALEAVFAVLFIATIAAITDDYFEHLLLWKRETATWKPLCSHLPLSEKIPGDLNLSFEELEVVGAMRIAKRRTYQTNLRESYKARDPAAYRARDRVIKNAWNDAHPGASTKTARKVRKKAKDERRWPCCGFTFTSQVALDRHRTSQQHTDAVDGVQKPVSAQTIINRAAKAAGTYRCHDCNKNFITQLALDQHKTRKTHDARVAENAEL